MSFQDKSILCIDCGIMFSFTTKEQELFESRSYADEPKRCPGCRQVRKSYNDNKTVRQMFPITCAECGDITEVPFQPRHDKPVYCSDCCLKVRPAKY